MHVVERDDDGANAAQRLQQQADRPMGTKALSLQGGGRTSA